MTISSCCQNFHFTVYSSHFQFVLSTIVRYIYLSIELAKVVCQDFKSEHIKSFNRHMQSLSYLFLICKLTLMVCRCQLRVQEIYDCIPKSNTTVTLWIVVFTPIATISVWHSSFHWHIIYLDCFREILGLQYFVLFPINWGNLLF